MLKTYFFVPANNPTFVEKSRTIQSDYFIFDLEDSVGPGDVEMALESLKRINPKPEHYVRPTFFSSESSAIDTELIECLIGAGFTGFIIPKFSDIAQLKEIKLMFESFSAYTPEKFRFVLLVEHPAGLLCVKEAIQQSGLHIVALGLGNHDYCNAMGMQHNLHNLYFARQIILNAAKAFGLDAIDIVSLDYTNEEKFCNEVFDGFSMGFDSKFIIHPNQLQLIRKVQYYSEEEVLEAQELYPQILDMIQHKTALFTYNGKVFEKPHINRILKIINWHNSHGNK
ncbi:MAG: hypothetical protein KA974_10435 [Saprospiraceae bacterium]|nr:hypothetical protein [Saprospiraceae bacterium]